VASARLLGERPIAIQAPAPQRRRFCEGPASAIDLVEAGVDVEDACDWQLHALGLGRTVAGVAACPFLVLVRSIIVEISCAAVPRS